MNRPLLGLVVGGLIGLFDGATAGVTAPEIFKAGAASILVGSAFKGLVGGLITGWIARRTGSLAKGITVGVATAVALALPVAYLNASQHQDPSIYWKIILPGAATGMIVGFAIVRYGRPAPAPAEAQ